MTPSRSALPALPDWLRIVASVAVALGAVAIVGVKLAMQLGAGPNWDTFSYLANAAAIAGRSIGYMEPWRSPGLSMLTAPILAVGGLSIAAIQFVDALVSLSGAFAFYFLLRRRLERLPAALGTLALLVAPPVWAWLGVGYSDFPSMALAFWAALFAVKATEEDPRFYLAVFPFAMAAVMTRVTSLLFVLPLGLWLVMRARPFPHFKHLVAGLLLALGVYAPAGFYYNQRFGDILYPFLISFGIAQEQVTNTTGFASGEPGGTSFAIAAMALAIALVAAAGLAQSARERLSEPGHPSGGRVTAALFATLVAAGAAYVGRGGIVLAQAAIVIGCLVVWSLLAPRDESGRIEHDHAMDAFMAAWLLAFGVWYATNPVKVARYETTFLPPIIYVTLLGLRSWITRLRAWSSDPRRVGAIMTGAVWGLVTLAIAVTLALDIAMTPTAPDPPSVAARDSALWLASHDPGSRSAAILSDVWPYTSWYLGTDVEPMPTFGDGRAFLHELDKRNIDYYFTVGRRSWEPTFTTAASFGNLRLLERAKAPDQSLPRVRYLGASWDNYLEQICGYSFYLDSNTGARHWEGSVFLDAYSAADLAKSDAVAAYGFRWHDRVAAERNLTQYVSDGGVVVMDATGDLAGNGYSVDGTSLFDVVVSRDSVPAKASWSLDPAFAARHPEVGAIDAAAYLADGGTTWHGAGYSPLGTVKGWQVLATLGGKPAVCVQTIGRGRVYWLAYNAAWHAFHTDSAGERRLVAAVFDEALGRTSGAAR